VRYTYQRSEMIARPYQAVPLRYRPYRQREYVLRPYITRALMWKEYRLKEKEEMVDAGRGFTDSDLALAGPEPDLGEGYQCALELEADKPFAEGRDGDPGRAGKRRKIRPGN